MLSSLNKLGKISLGIYAAHYILIGKIAIIYLDMRMGDGIVVLLSFVTGVFVSWLIVWLMSKWNITNQLFLGKV